MVPDATNLLRYASVEAKEGKVEMGGTEAKFKVSLGFLTVVDHPQHGLCGGYLVLNGCGRPIEFHCTAPIRPNRAQQILYGPTLEPFLYGEQIGQTLVSKAKSAPTVICTDRVPALELRPLIETPVALVVASPSLSDPAGSVQCARSLVRFTVGCNELAVAPEFERDRTEILDRLASLSESFDLAEPFLRIREAIEEAQRAVRACA